MQDISDMSWQLWQRITAIETQVFLFNGEHWQWTLRRRVKVAVCPNMQECWISIMVKANSRWLSLTEQCKERKLYIGIDAESMEDLRFLAGFHDIISLLFIPPCTTNLGVAQIDGKGTPIPSLIQKMPHKIAHRLVRLDNFFIEIYYPKKTLAHFKLTLKIVITLGKFEENFKCCCEGCILECFGGMFSRSLQVTCLSL